ncbi:MAG: 2-oxo acid dehydrogenase subunit E2 [Acidobacteriota bacterium]|nr:MAG: 2-oxo acid dehydrogenase subunit E2 [Acidobacteriota bacterium]
MAFEFKLPDIGEGVVEGEIVRWLVKPADEVEEDQPMVEIMTDKATVEIPSPVKGVVLECRGDEGDIVDVGETLVVIQQEGETEAPAPAEKPAEGKPAEPATPPVRKAPEAPARGILATPAVRKLAREKGIDLSKIQGSGRGGRITPEDLEKTPSAEEVKSPARTAAKPLLEIETVPYRGLRRKIGKHLIMAKQAAVHYTYVEECDVTTLVRLKNEFAEQDGYQKLTYLPFIMKAVVAGLKKYPLLNATLDEEKEQILLKKYYNLGLAAATNEGLVVPVIKHVEEKDILELSAEIQRLVEDTRAGKTKLEDLQGGTFTITSLGPLGGLMATPVINYPEVAILGIHKISKRPVVRDDRIVVRQIMNLSVTLDHRVVDGIVAAEFLHFVIRCLENPGLLMLHR